MAKVTLAKVDLNTNSFLYIELQKIYGIGLFFSLFSCRILGLNIRIKFFELEATEIEALDFFLHNFFIFGIELHKKNFLIRKKHLDMKNYKGLKYKLKSRMIE